jgi:hypothetical protein
VGNTSISLLMIMPEGSAQGSDRGSPGGSRDQRSLPTGSLLFAYAFYAPPTNGRFKPQTCFFYPIQFPPFMLSFNHRKTHMILVCFPTHKNYSCPFHGGTMLHVQNKTKRLDYGLWPLGKENSKPVPSHRA